jgi:DNA gyrase subunit B
MVVEVRWNDGQVYRHRFERGKPATELEVIGKTRDTGSKTTFKADYEIFEELEYDFDTLSQRLKELSFLNRGIKITLKDEREGKEMKKFIIMKEE